MKDFYSEKSVLALAQLNLLQLQTTFEWDKQNSWVKRGKDGRFGSGSSVVPAHEDRVTDNARVRESLLKVGIDPDKATIALGRLESRPKDYSPVYQAFLAPFQRDYANSKNLRQQDLERFEKCIKEIDRLSHSRNWENNRDLAWRVGVVKAEINYGDLINQVVDIDMPGNSINIFAFFTDIFNDMSAHKKLLQRLSKGTKATGIRKATPEESKAVRDYLDAVLSKTPGGKGINGFTKIGNPLKEQQLVSKALKPALEFQKLVHPELPALLDASMARGFTTDLKSMKLGAKILNIPLNIPNNSENFRYINVGNYSGGVVDYVMDHELGHALEIKLDQVTTSKRFLSTRSESLLPINMKDYGMPGEIAVKDSFSHPYTGKIYPAMNATEVVSTATQSLSSPLALSTQSYLDREHIMYGLSVMDMKEGDRFPGGER
jgi:hypothetical protein